MAPGVRLCPLLSSTLPALTPFTNSSYFVSTPLVWRLYTSRTGPSSSLNSQLIYWPLWSAPLSFGPGSSGPLKNAIETSVWVCLTASTIFQVRRRWDVAFCPLPSHKTPKISLYKVQISTGRCYYCYYANHLFVLSRFSFLLIPADSKANIKTWNQSQKGSQHLALVHVCC